MVTRGVILRPTYVREKVSNWIHRSMCIQVEDILLSLKGIFFPALFPVTQCVEKEMVQSRTLLVPDSLAS